MKKVIEKYKALSNPAKAALWFAVCAAIQKGINFITVPVFTRLLTTTQYGQISIYLSWYSIISIFLTLNLYQGGFNNAMIQNENKRDEYLSSVQGLVTTLTVVMYFFYRCTSSFWNRILEMDMYMVTAMFLEILFHSALMFWAAKERFEYRYKCLTIYTLLATLIPSLAAAVAILICPENYGAEVKIYVNAVFVIILCLPVYTRNISRKKFFYNKKFWSFGVMFNTPLIPHYLSGVILNQADRIMISKMVGQAEAGIYSLAYSASMALNIVTASINQSFAPWLYGKLKKKTYDDISRVTSCFFSGVAILILLLVVFAPECVVIFGGNKFKDAIWIIPSVASSLYFNFIYVIFANVEFYFMKNKYISYASVFGAILNIVLNYFGIAWFGYLAAGYTTLICYVVFAVSHYVFVRKVIKENIGNEILFNGKIVFAIGICLIACCYVLLLLYKHTMIRYVILGVAIITIILNKKVILNILGEIRK